MKRILLTSFLLCAMAVFAKNSASTAQPEKPQAKVFFSNLKEGQTISTEQKVQFGIEGMSVGKAGEKMEDKKVGHHHLLINKGPVAEGKIIPADADHLHFGQAQTETVLKLKPGNYSLTLQFADGAHQSYGEKLSSTVKVTVK
ncbi:MAG: DUF4399 domain-containing protein [Bdellovibrionota bacterium]|mgnify:CR=1 FL=1